MATFALYTVSVPNFVYPALPAQQKTLVESLHLPRALSNSAWCSWAGGGLDYGSARASCGSRAQATSQRNPRQVKSLQFPRTLPDSAFPTSQKDQLSCEALDVIQPHYGTSSAANQRLLIRGGEGSEVFQHSAFA